MKIDMHRRNNNKWTHHRKLQQRILTRHWNQYNQINGIPTSSFHRPSAEQRLGFWKGLVEDYETFLIHCARPCTFSAANQVPFCWRRFSCDSPNCWPRRQSIVSSFSRFVRCKTSARMNETSTLFLYLCEQIEDQGGGFEIVPLNFPKSDCHILSGQIHVSGCNSVFRLLQSCVEGR